MIRLDSDGVFAGWVQYTIPKHFPEYTPQEFNKLPELKRRGLMREMYRKEPNLFYNLPPFLEMMRVLEELERLCVPWSILTSGSEDHFDRDLVVECKQLWFDKHFGVPADKVIVTETSHDKKIYAGPGTLLIDDFGRNCREWALSGGTAYWVETDKPNPTDLIRHINAFVESPNMNAGSILQIRAA